MDDARVFLGSGGGDAIDTAAKIARRHWFLRGQPERVHLISRTHGYHGTHGFGTSIGGIEANVTNWGPLVPRRRRRSSATRSRPSRPRSCASVPTAWRPSSASR